MWIFHLLVIDWFIALNARDAAKGGGRGIIIILILILHPQILFRLYGLTSFILIGTILLGDEIKIQRRVNEESNRIEG